MFLLRNSPENDASSGTAFRTVPPLMMPTLKVVSSSSRPCGNWPMISAAMRMAESPFSGSTPACAARPFTRTSNRMYVGVATVILLTGPLPSNTTASFAWSMLKSSAFAPSSPTSSPRVKTTWAGIRWAPSSLIASSPSRIAAIPALQSPPSIVVPSVRIWSPSTMGLIPLPGSTVSMCADSNRGESPTSDPMTLPCASRPTWNPRASSLLVRSRATASSSPEGLSIRTRSQKLLTSRSRSTIWSSVLPKSARPGRSTVIIASPQCSLPPHSER